MAKTPLSERSAPGAPAESAAGVTTIVTTFTPSIASNSSSKIHDASRFSQLNFWKVGRIAPVNHPRVKTIEIVPINVGAAGFGIEGEKACETVDLWKWLIKCNQARFEDLLDRLLRQEADDPWRYIGHAKHGASCGEIF